MSEPRGSDWAGAIQTTGEFGKALVNATSRLGRFVAPTLAPFLGMVQDAGEHWRAHLQKRRKRFEQVSGDLLDERGLESPTRPIPERLLLTILRNGPDEEDETLQDVWARMLVNAADAASGTEAHVAFGSILAEMSPADVATLALIHRLAPSTPDGRVFTVNFPDEDQSDRGVRPSQPPERVQVSLGNLNRLGCVVGATTLGGGYTDMHVSLTPFGRAFIRACTV